MNTLRIAMPWILVGIAVGAVVGALIMTYVYGRIIDGPKKQ